MCASSYLIEKISCEGLHQAAYREVGLILGEIAAYFLAIIGDWVFSIQLETVLLALGFSLVVGVVFGVWPARTAAKLEPIDALRFE